MAPECLGCGKEGVLPHEGCIWAPSAKGAHVGLCPHCKEMIKLGEKSMSKFVCLNCNTKTGNLLQAYCPKCAIKGGGSFWNNRIMESGKGLNRFLSVREVYYDDTGKIEAWDSDPIRITGEDVKDLRDGLTQILKDILKTDIPLVEDELLEAQKTSKMLKDIFDPAKEKKSAKRDNKTSGSKVRILKKKTSGSKG